MYQLDVWQVKFYHWLLFFCDPLTYSYSPPWVQYLPECNRVVHLVGGRVGECGSHSDLMAAGGEYAALFNSHLSTAAGSQDTAPTASDNPARNKLRTRTR